MIKNNLLLRPWVRDILKKIISTFKSMLLSYPKNVQCNVCGWSGRHFQSDAWHTHIICPKCYSDIRQRLFFLALQNIESLSFEKLLNEKRILHFAPEDIVSSNLRNKSVHYFTADFLRSDCDFKLDMSNMPEIRSESYDIVIAFDVLEHVADYQKAIDETHRVLSSKGFAIFTVPQKDNLLKTYEDKTIVTPEDREKHFGQWDHLRIFGDDFPEIIESKGFSVISVNESMFSKEENKMHVLFPSLLSKHPLATNYRKVFFCQKTS